MDLTPAGHDIGRALATALGWEFADREIITKAAESFGEGVRELRHATEEKPTLWDRFRESQQRDATYVEAVLLEMAARDNVGLVGRASTVILRDVRRRRWTTCGTATMTWPPAFDSSTTSTGRPRGCTTSCSTRSG